MRTKFTLPLLFLLTLMIGSCHKSPTMKNIELSLTSLTDLGDNKRVYPFHYDALDDAEVRFYIRTTNKRVLNFTTNFINGTKLEVDFPLFKDKKTLVTVQNHKFTLPLMNLNRVDESKALKFSYLQPNEKIFSCKIAFNKSQQPKEVLEAIGGESAKNIESSNFIANQQIIPIHQEGDTLFTYTIWSVIAHNKVDMWTPKAQDIREE